MLLGAVDDESREIVSPGFKSSHAGVGACLSDQTPDRVRMLGRQYSRQVVTCSNDRADGLYNRLSDRRSRGAIGYSVFARPVVEQAIREVQAHRDCIED